MIYGFITWSFWCLSGLLDLDLCRRAEEGMATHSRCTRVVNPPGVLDLSTHPQPPPSLGRGCRVAQLWCFSIIQLGGAPLTNEGRHSTAIFNECSESSPPEPGRGRGGLTAIPLGLQSHQAVKDGNPRSGEFNQCKGAEPTPSPLPVLGGDVEPPIFGVSRLFSWEGRRL